MEMESSNVTVTQNLKKLVEFTFNREKEIIFMDSEQVAHYTEERKGVNDYEKSFDPCSAKNNEIANCFNREFHSRINSALDKMVEIPAQEAEAIERELRTLNDFINENFTSAFLKTVKTDTVYAELLFEIKSQKHTEEKEAALVAELNAAVPIELSRANLNDVLLFSSSDEICTHIKEFNSHA
jgi:hypothetical protein